MFLYNYVNFSIFLNIFVFYFLPFFQAKKKDVLMSNFLLRKDFKFSIKYIIVQLNPGPCLDV